MKTKHTKTNKIILLVEDERPLVRVIEKKLHEGGFEVITARTVDQALSYMKEIPTIAAVWLDHYLFGDKTGLDFVAALKAPKSTWTKVPIFVVSNTASNANLRSYISLGVDKYCVKSNHRLDQMVGDIKAFLANKRT